MQSEEDFVTCLNQGLRTELFDWLVDARYWLGFMVGRSENSFPLFGPDLKFSWYASWGIRVNISPTSKQSHYYEIFEKASSEFCSKVFEYRIPYSESKYIDSSFLKIVSESEYLIEKFFPGIQRYNTWAICNSQESENCFGQQGYASLCYVIGDAIICENCSNAKKDKDAKGFEGFVYLIGNHEQKVYKIGLSRQPKERYKAFGTKLPFKVEILHQIETTDMKKAEKILHDWMKDKNTHGEWFNLSQNDVEFLCKLATFEKDNFIDAFGNAVLDYPE